MASLKRICIIFLLSLIVCSCSSSPEVEKKDSNKVTSPVAVKEQSSNLKYTEAEDEYQIDLSGTGERPIKDISYTLLYRDPEYNYGNSYVALLEDCAIEPDETKTVHIPKKQTVCSVYDAEEDKYTPVCRLHPEDSDHWSGQTAALSETDADITDFVSANLKLSKNTDSKDYLSWQLTQRDIPGVNPLNADYLLNHGSVFTFGYSSRIPVYDANDQILPYYSWDVYMLYRNNIQCGNINKNLRFKAFDVSELGMDTFIQLAITYEDGSFAASDLMPLTASTSEEKAKKARDMIFPTEKGTLSFSIEDGEAALTEYKGDDSVVTVPEEVEGCPVTVIENDSFEGSSASDPSILEEIVFPDTVKEIEEYSISFYDELKRINIPSSAIFSSGAISNCPKLSDLIIDEKKSEYKIINGCLFSKNGKTLIYAPPTLSGKYTVPKGVEEIASYAFSDCKLLSEVTFPDTLKRIGFYAFQDTRLKKIDFPESLAVIGDHAFSSWSISSLYDDVEIEYDDEGNPIKSYEIPRITLHIGKNIEQIGNKAFSGYLIEKYDVDPENPYYSSKDGLLLTKDGSFLVSCPVGAKGTFTLPEGIINIASDAFESNENSDSYYIDQEGSESGISSLILPESLAYFDSNNLPESIKELTVKSDIKEWINLDGCREITIHGLENVKSFTIENGIIYDKDKTSLLLYPADSEESSYTLPETLKSIEGGAFPQNEYLKKIVIPKETTLDDIIDSDVEGVVQTLPSLTEFEVDGDNRRFSTSDGVLFSKETGALLYYPPGLSDSSYSVPDGTKTILTESFTNASLTELYIPASVKRLDSAAGEVTCLSYLHELKKVEIAEDNPYLKCIDGAVINIEDQQLLQYVCTGDEILNLPDGIMTVSENAFDFSDSYDIPNPVEIHFQEGLKKIESGNFNYLDSDDPWDKILIYLPDTLEEIADNSFTDSPAIELHVVNGSYGEEYAKNHGLNYFTDYPK